MPISITRSSRNTMKLLCTKFQVDWTKNKVVWSQRLMTLSPATLTEEKRKAEEEAARLETARLAEVSVSRLRETKGKCGNLTRWERATSNLHQSCHRARFSDSGPNLRLRMDAKVIHALFLADRTSKCVFLVFFLYNPYYYMSLM